MNQHTQVPALTHSLTHTHTHTHTHTPNHSFPIYSQAELARDILHPPLKPPSPSLQPLHLINADSQLTQARITNLFHLSSAPLMTHDVLCYLSLSLLPRDTSEFISKCPEPALNAAALMRRKMNMVEVVFIVLKGTATYQDPSRRLFLAVNCSPVSTYSQSVFTFFYVSHLLCRWCQPLCTNPGIVCFKRGSREGWKVVVN